MPPRPATLQPKDDREKEEFDNISADYITSCKDVKKLMRLEAYMRDQGYDATADAAAHRLRELGQRAAGSEAAAIDPEAARQAAEAKRAAAADIAAWSTVQKKTEAALEAARQAASGRDGKKAKADSAVGLQRLLELNRSLSAPERLALSGQEKAKGNEHFRAKEYVEAVELYTLALGLRGAAGDAALFANRAAAYVKLSMWDCAETDCSAALEADPASYKSYVRRAAARLQLGKLMEAKADAETALALQPGHVDATGLRERILKALEAKGMKRMYEAAVAAIKEAGNMAFKAQQYVQAARQYSDALELAPDLQLLYINRSMARLNNKLAREALVDACVAVALDPTSYKALHKRARAKVQLRLWQSACDDLLQCHDLIPAKDAKVTIEEHSDHEDEAGDDKPDIDPEEVEAMEADALRAVPQLRAAGEAARAAWLQPAEAAAKYREALELDPTNVPVLCNLLMALNMQQRWPETEAVAAQLLQVVEGGDAADVAGFTSKALHRRSQARKCLGRLEEAAADLRRALDLNSGVSATRAQLELELKGDAGNSEEAARLREEGNRLFGVGNYVRAGDLYSRSIRACAQNPAAYCNRAFVHLHLKRPADALLDAEAALEQSGGRYPKAQLRRALALRDLGRYAEAAETLAPLLEAQPGDAALQEEMARVIKANLSTRMVQALVDAAKGAVGAAEGSSEALDVDYAARSLEALTLVQRFEMNYGLVAKAVKEDVRAVVNALAAAGRDVALLRKSYKL
eukprot:XP_001694175.1 predicted protein [Chlamydomonas reinhardtii]